MDNSDNNNPQNNDCMNNLKSSLLLLNDINDAINNNLSKSVLDLVNCFICLSPVNEPLSCPKCNNFACKKCLEKYFGGETEKRCPLCKKDIKLNELKENKIVEEIETILNKNEDKVIKYNELSALIEQKKNSWSNQAGDISNLIDKIFKYQEKLQKYKNEYYIFISNSKKLIEETFEDIEKKVENIVNSLLSYNTIVDNSIQKYDTIYKNTIKNNCDSNNFKQLINEILSLERKKFNITIHSDTEHFLNTPIRLIPSINVYNIKHFSYKANNFNYSIPFTFNGNHFKIGDYDLVYDTIKNDGHKIICSLTFTVKDDYTKKMCFLLSQIVEFKDKKEILIPMTLLQNEGKKYDFICTIECEEFYNLNNNDEFNIKTEALIFTM